jgi:hypothetical protein
MYRELRVAGSFIYFGRDFRRAMSLLTHEQFAIEDQMIMHHFPLARGEEAICTAESGADALKVVIDVV